MATIREQVLAAIKAEYPQTLTNNQLSIRLGLNEPSVRRVTKSLDDARLIRFGGQDYTTGQIFWKANEPVAAQA